MSIMTKVLQSHDYIINKTLPVVQQISNTKRLSIYNLPTHKDINYATTYNATYSGIYFHTLEFCNWLTNKLKAYYK